MAWRGIAAIAVMWWACLAAFVPQAAGDSRSCGRIVNPYEGTRYEGVDLRKIQAKGTSCETARDVTRGAHRKALRMTPTPNGILTYEWHAWSVRGDLRGNHDDYVAKRGAKRVRWVF